MRNLRFLSVENCEHIDLLLGIIAKTLTLKWLRIHVSTRHDNILEQHTYFIKEFMKVGEDHLQQLGVLELFNIIISTPTLFQNFQPQFLKELSIIDCTFPQGKFPVGLQNLRLEELTLKNCKSLRTIPEGLGGLTCLKKLYMNDCEALEEFPLGICTLKALEDLQLEGCKSLKTIPEGLGGLTCLKKLYMYDCEALEEFPSGIRTLKALEDLQFNGCKSLRTIPEGLGGLTCLKIL
jgi:Leucine-rich repeat (LRR) protein